LAVEIRQRLKPEIGLEVSTEFLERETMLFWLSMNDINCFYYDNQPGRGVSSVLDFAVAALKPIGVSNSNMFRHVTHERQILLDENTIPEIIEFGSRPVTQFYWDWSPYHVVREYDLIFEEFGCVAK
jgi:hypothetical protein